MKDKKTKTLTRSDANIQEDLNNSELNEIVVAINDAQSVQLDDEELPPGFWDVFKSISSISIPTALSYTYSFEVALIVVLINYLSESEEEVAAATLITLLMNTLIIIGMSPLFAINVLGSNKIGEYEEAVEQGQNEVELSQKRSYIADFNRNGMLLTACLTPPIVAGLFFSKPILTGLLGQNEEVAELAQDFLRVYSPAVPAILARIAAEQTLLGFKRSKQAMVMGLTNLGLGTGLSLWLGVGGLGVPAMGATGVAIGYAAEAYLTATAYSLYLALHKDFKDFEFFKVFKRIDGSQLRGLLKIGSSISFSLMSETAMSLSLGLFSGLLGTEQQSAMAYVNQYVFLNFLLSSSFGQTCAQEVNRQIGRKKYENASRIGKYGLITTLIYTTPLPVFFAIAPNLLVISEHDQSELKAMLKVLAPIISSGCIIDVVRYNILQQDRPLSDLKIPTLISVGALTSGIGLSAVLGLETPMGINGVASGYLIGMVIATPLLAYRWRQRIAPGKIQEVVEKAPEPESNSAHSILSIFNKCRRNKAEVYEGEKLNEYKGANYGN